MAPEFPCRSVGCGGDASGRPSIRIGWRWICN